LRSLVGDLVLVRLQEERDPLLHKRLYNALRRAILDGSLAPQSRLPPSRDLAGELGVSRNTILTTYEQLLAEGYVVSRRGSGTFVAQTAPESSLTAKGQRKTAVSRHRRRIFHAAASICSARSAPARASGERLFPACRTLTPFPTRCSVRSRPASAVGQTRAAQL
jgi:DNA-binding transcriptional MocR family regulator